MDQFVFKYSKLKATTNVLNIQNQNLCKKCLIDEPNSILPLTNTIIAQNDQNIVKMLI